MAWLRIELSEEERRIVLVERESHSSDCVRRRSRAIWLLHSGLKREQAAKLLGGDGAARRPGVSHRRAGSPADLRAGRSPDQ
jgi:hypothetical protein